MENTVFNDRYKIVEKIGSGGMADVYKAEDQVLQRTVALKILHVQFAEDQSFLERFRREGRAAAKLTHPNIVSIYDVGEENGTHYIVMEYAAGKNLKEIIERDAPLPPEKAIYIASQICSAVEFAHQHEIIHRDIKPHNVIISEAGETSEPEIKVTDFGIARLGATSTMTRTGSIMGTAHYISPEQAQGGVVGPGSDIYSLGVVLYEMLTGELPFRGENAVAVALKHIHETPMPPRTVYSAIPESLEAVVLKAMAKDPADRYHSASKMQADLQRCLAGLPISFVTSHAAETMVGEATGRTQVARRAKRPASRRWLLPLLIILALLIAAGGFALAYYFLSPTTVVVPDLKGKTLAQAQRIVESKSLKLEVAREAYNESVAPGRIISQSPSAGEKIRKDGTVGVVLSRGLQTVKVPDLVGKTVDEADAVLKSAGLSVGKIERIYSDEPEDTVIRQSPKPGAKVEKGSAVDITLSQGTQLVRVPDVAGRTATEASLILENAGFKVSRVDDFSDTVAKDYIIRQTPAAGEKVPKGSGITIAVSKGSRQVQLIDLRGKTRNDAESWITSHELTANTVVKTNPAVPVGQVYDQNPTPGTMVDKGSTVTIYVSAGP